MYLYKKNRNMSVNSLHFSIPNGTLEHLGVHITSLGFQPSWGREGRGDTSAGTQNQGVSVGFHRGVAAPSQWAGGGQGWVSWDRGRGGGDGKTAAGGRPAGNIIKPATGFLNYIRKDKFV